MGYSVIALDYFLLKVILYNSILWRQYIWDRVPPSFFYCHDTLLWHPSVTIILPLHPSLSSLRCRQLPVTSFSIIHPLQTALHYILLYHPLVTNIFPFHPSRCILPNIWQLV